MSSKGKKYILNVCCVLKIELNFHSMSQLMYHFPDLVAIYRKHKWYVVHKECNKTTVVDIKDHSLYQFVDTGQVQKVCTSNQEYI